MNASRMPSCRPDHVASTVAILLCSYQGQHYLPEQLDSFAAQSDKNWTVWASDDGSKDDTRAILEAYRQKWGNDRLFIRSGPAAGFVANFMSLVCNREIRADFYAYSDQDDIWESDKLQRAMDWLLTMPQDVPALYCSRTRLVDANDQEIGLTTLYVKPPSFANALMQNIGGGNTMVFNDAARALLCEAGADVTVFAHDWWTYLVVSGCGGRVYYDAHPSLRYRQHGNNSLGASSGWGARFALLQKVWRGNTRIWNERHLLALQRLQMRLTEENRRMLDRFALARNQWLLPRLIGLMRCGVYRQTLLGNLDLILAALLKKM
ncbi:MAG TPA: glycosyltransferase family 2 protein [Burkholderiaceae bacterium]|jgi:glycosyltransferase involved in cell wall biosynthesis|nr:glycosyltransferase family 2 protein [Burkholderiaceae bacterium]